MSDVQRLKELIETAEKTVFFGGAGVSTESGIPDFRSETGLYNAKREFGRSPEEIISHSFFIRNPDVFFHYYKTQMIFPSAQANGAHRTLVKFEADGLDIKIVTQNIDGLHQKAGSKNVYELHGSVHRNYCMECGENYSLEYVLDETNCADPKGITTYVPYCKKCGGIVRPDVVLYEEGLDAGTIDASVDAISSAELLIVGGTSLAVYPAAGFLSYFRGRSIVLINKGATRIDKDADLVIREPIGEVFSRML